ncbi:PWI+4CCCH domains [Cryptosporidium sp. chipmunk genotype I]|uniref:PWI+4CCCH domains n=1 Tax=Cryptosporidium sp. chipmunk genotype I TaxID=1280935 RepID=UPI00351A2001|nr:PWI+4CCCH domains [Cryptosporidium sp. chipmunk genotype I]
MDSSSGGGPSIGEVVTPEVQSKITSKLQEIFGDDDVSVLTDYICHMVNHNQPKEHIVNELKEFLSDEASQFGTWVFQLVESSKNDYSSNIMPNINRDNNTGRNNSAPSDPHKSSSYSSQNKDSLDFAISNAIKNKSGSGRIKPFQTASSHRNNHSLINHESSSGPITGNNRLPRVNYRNAPYTRTSNFNQSGAPYNSSNQTANASTGPSSTHGKIKIRCKNWPNCDKGDHCFYIHPNEACKSWPLCPYGPGCFFIHPTVPCRYGLACYNSLCNYSHPNGWDPNHVEAPIFKYGGYKNSSLIINNNKPPQTIGNANSNSAESNNNDNTNPISKNLNQENVEMPSYDPTHSGNTGHFSLESEKNNSFRHN